MLMQFIRKNMNRNNSIIRLNMEDIAYNLDNYIGRIIKIISICHSLA